MNARSPRPLARCRTGDNAICSDLGTVPGNVDLFDGVAGAEAALLGMVCLVVAVAGILRILTCAEGRAADKVLKSFCSENSSIPPFTRIGKFSRPLAEKKRVKIKI